MCAFFGSAQINDDAYLFNTYQDYGKLPRETAYGHLNKSTLINGESLGFTVYLFDKYTKRSSIVTRNVYCTIENSAGKILKKKLILATNGVASGSIEIDSVFASGNYIFKAFTNWMKNFEEQNFYVQHIKVINPEDNNNNEEEEDYFDIEAQFLPEGGHLVLDIKNTVGVVVKDDYGFGVPNLRGTLTDGYDLELTNFITNAFGIAKFEFTPKSRRIYKVEFDDEEETVVTLDSGKARGIAMSLKDLDNKLALVFRTNASTLPTIANQTFKLTFSNGNQLNATDIKFGDNSEITTLISHDDLFTGINIITLFDATNQPMLERLYFKHNGISHLKTQAVNVIASKDSLEISIAAKNINNQEIHNLSISVLPEGTKSYNHHHNIVSYTFLKPYVKGRIENAKYYFTAINKKKILELDNLLLTQGWSSYDWTTIFNNPPVKRFEFEDGLTINASLNNTKGNKFVIYPQQNTPTITLELKDGQRNFITKGLLPMEGETLKIGVVDKNDRVERPNLYVQFSPTEIPQLSGAFASLKYSNNSGYSFNSDRPILDESWKNIQELDEVVLTAKKEEERFEKIKRFNKGRVDVFTDSQRKNTTDFASYIATKGFRVFQDPRDPRSLIIQLPRRTTFQDNSSQMRPLIYLNNLLIDQEDHRFLMDLDMSTLDYVIIDKQGLGEGMRGANGVIKIFTNSELRTREYNITRDAGQEIKVPLAFSARKKFYAPTYSSYSTDFFENYGVIDWFSHCTVDKDGYIKFKIKDTKNKQLKLFIEGIANDGSFISEEKLINSN
ncbi:hypothetical protein SAMN04515667_0672 [Formosa sp. Hel1_31_208]|nr:hypothetical protein SAMN04515667_0672 [Formosa sp. Hel1_31_208]